MRKAAYIGGAILLLIVFVAVFFRPTTNQTRSVPISSLIEDLRAGQVDEIEVRGNTLEVTLKGSAVVSYRSTKESGSSLLAILAANEIDASEVVIKVNDEAGAADWLALLLNFVPLLVFGGLIYALIRALNRVGSK